MGGNTGKILITGATGFIGYEVAKQLAHKGYTPRLMVRRPLRGFLLKSLDAELMQGDLGQPRSLKRILEGIDTVIHLGPVPPLKLPDPYGLQLLKDRLT